jgi:hypothetical protein
MVLLELAIKDTTTRPLHDVYTAIENFIQANK